MKLVPPRGVRRVVVAPLVAAVDLAVLALTPLALLLGLAAAPLVGTRAMRMALIVAAWAARHLEALVALLALWLRAGIGRRGTAEDVEAAHYEVMRRFVSGVNGAMERAARVEVAIDESEEARRALDAGDRPVVVLSRHAGEGDTILVIHQLLCRHGRRPRVVMHEALRLDPLIDVLGERLPHRFVDPRGGDTEHEIAAMASGLDEQGAVVIFPEGANFSEERRRRGIERLERAGHERQAETARALRHLSAPRPGGALAAIDAAPGADVIVIGHVGFPAGLGEVWRLLPERQTIEVKLWHEPAEAIPAEREARIRWLFEQWRRLDEWVQGRVSGTGPPPAGGPAPPPPGRPPR